MKILMVSQWWPPEPATIVSSLADAFDEHGHDVHVITGFPNYPEGKLYPGYKISFRDRSKRGRIGVTRVPLYPSHDRSALGRMANYVSFGLSSLFIGVLTAPKPDIVYVYHPPITSAWAGLAARFVRRVPYVLHVQDIWPDSVTESGMVRKGVTTRFVKAVLGAMCRAAYWGADRIIVISPGMKDLLVERGVEPAKIEVVRNWSDEALHGPEPIDAASREALGWASRRVVLYAGNFGDYQGLDSAVRAAAAIADTTNIHLALIGGGIARERIVELVDRLGAKNVELLDRVEPSAMSTYHSSADFHLVSLIDLPFFAVTIPGKTQVALATGKPVVMAVRGDAADLITAARAGIVASPDVDGIREAFEAVARLSDEEVATMASDARSYYLENLSLEIGSRKIEDILGRSSGKR